MYNFIVPEYKGENIVNLISTITNKLSKKKHKYPILKEKILDKINDYDNVILIIIDGLGYNYIKKQKKSFLHKNIKMKLTSTFLSTTVCANTVFSVGYPTQQHGLTGWYMYLKEIDEIVKVLRFKTVSDKSLKGKIKMNQIFNMKSIHDYKNREKYTLMNKEISNSPFTKQVSNKIIPCKNYEESLRKTKKIIKASKKKKFIHIYINDFDSCAHEYSPNSKECKKIYSYLDEKIQKLSFEIKNTNSKIIITADHGLIEHTKKEIIFLDNIKGLHECLRNPPTGENRVLYFHVKKNKKKEFEKIMKKMSKYLWLYKSKQIIKDKFYGLGKVNPKLIDRVGDYTTIMKNKYILENLSNFQEINNKKLGAHGGVHEDEMYVPLIVIDC
jgi:hypothetical protein